MAKLAVGSSVTFTGVCKYNGASGTMYYQVRMILLLVSQNIATNKSTVKRTLQIRCINDSYRTYNVPANAIIDGVAQTAVTIDTDPINTWDTIAERTSEVSHNTDGTLTLSTSASFTVTLPGGTTIYALKSGSVSGSQELVDIPRASAISTFNTFEIGADIPVVLTRYSASFTDDIVLKINDVECLSRTGITTSYTIAPSDAEREAMIVAALDGAISASLIVTTKNGSTTVGTKTKTVSATLKTGFTPYERPKVNAFDAVRCLVDGTEDIFGEYVKFIFDLSASSLIYDSGDSETNFLKYQIKYKLRSESTWTVLTLTTASGLTWSSYDLLSGFVVSGSFDARITVYDAYGSYFVSDTIPQGMSYLWGNDVGDGVGVGVKGEDGYNLTVGPKGINSYGPIMVNGEELADIYLTLDGLIEGYSVSTMDSIIGGTF